MKLDHSANRKFRTSLKSFTLPTFPIRQSNKIYIKDIPYLVVGQFIHHIPLFTNFDVLNEYGERADEEIAQKVYEYISKLQVSHWICVDLKPLLEEIAANPIISEVGDEEIIQVVQKKSGQSVQNLLKASAEVVPHIQNLEKCIREIYEQDEWTEDLLTSFLNTWDNFWKVYNNRLQTLFVLAEYAIEEELFHEDDTVFTLFLEASYVYRFFTDTTLTDQPQTSNITDLIHINYKMNKIDPSHNEEQTLTALERFVHSALTLIVNLLWLLISISLLSFFFVDRDLSNIVILAVAMIVFYFIYKANQMRLRVKIRLLLRENKDKNHLETEHDRSIPFKYYIFTAIPTAPTKMITLIGFYIVVVSILTIFTVGYFDGLMFLTAFFGAICMLFGQVPVVKIIFRRQVVLRENAVQIGRKKLDTSDILQVNNEGDGMKFSFHLKDVKNPMTLEVSERERDETQTKLKQWCKQLNIKFTNERENLGEVS